MLSVLVLVLERPEASKQNAEWMVDSSLVDGRRQISPVAFGGVEVESSTLIDESERLLLIGRGGEDEGKMQRVDLRAPSPLNKHDWLIQRLGRGLCA